MSTILNINDYSNSVKINSPANTGKIVEFAITRNKSDGTPDRRYGRRSIRGDRKTKGTECLYTDEEILAVFQIFKDRVTYASSLSKEHIARRNLCMFVCSIVIGLRGGDFCSLRWSDIYDEKWEYKYKPEFIPQKTIKHNLDGTIKSFKRIFLVWNMDFEAALSDFLSWSRNNIKIPGLNDFIFPSQKGGCIGNKEWWKIMEHTRKAAGIKQSIGTHGLRKTMVHNYITKSDNPLKAAQEMQKYLGHSDISITLDYACITTEEIKKGKERMELFKGLL